MKTIEKVHIIPLGFERSVAVKPIRVLGGVRAHVITIGGKFAEKYELHEKQRYFERAVVADLEKLGLEVKVHYADLFDFRMAVGAIAEVVVEEKSAGSEVYLNLSSHGRLVSVASALVGWYHGVRMFYVFAERYARDEEEERMYGRSVCEKPVIFEIPSLEFVKLSEEERYAISLIYSQREHGKDYMKLRDLSERLEIQFPHIYSFSGEGRRKGQELLNKVNRRVVSRLEARGLIEKEKVGRNVILMLTKLGEFFALLG
ncbi:DUF6293 family protein [Methermicoccus shengliensis]|uniref:Uncharacterized protein n=1 Tax=Methermicoccus shengliensis TaxID=660064 RepID=A0A832VZN8_9EURY|nr:DUF6293 family protein [Methermicoccus shengliensis]KUK04834.1 MAG: Uncharacterized protein XD46_0365 [Euryarchaeota archaeon 55_53]KUK30462.1 MAG: Uncharacterized protein XD62_0432 [Methanosarcinales archeaon 56_1174]MDI3487874.1 hypothetical protein [Methanosarcinales archaeon]MDN5295384.1 hypothetical protein [Methanosarcinales archaeon]HIH69530.1 hypothetical protein [Methermicoccus shengliensis]